MAAADYDCSRPERATQWVVITGPPSAGKTSVIEALAGMGQPIVAETARHYLASLPHRPTEIAADQALQRQIQRSISRLQREIEAALPTGDRIFLDRALPDSLAYFGRLGLPTHELLSHSSHYRYRQIFFLDGLPLAEDGIRFERAEELELLATQILAAYAGLGYSPIRVPVFETLAPQEAVAARVDFILRESRC